MDNHIHINEWKQENNKMVEKESHDTFINNTANLQSHAHRDGIEKYFTLMLKSNPDFVNELTEMNVDKKMKQLFQTNNKTPPPPTLKKSEKENVVQPIDLMTFNIDRVTPPPSPPSARLWTRSWRSKRSFTLDKAFHQPLQFRPSHFFKKRNIHPSFGGGACLRNLTLIFELDRDVYDNNPLLSDSHHLLSGFNVMLNDQKVLFQLTDNPFYVLLGTMFYKTTTTINGGGKVRLHYKIPNLDEMSTISMGVDDQLKVHLKPSKIINRKIIKKLSRGEKRLNEDTLELMANTRVYMEIDILPGVADDNYQSTILFPRIVPLKKVKLNEQLPATLVPFELDYQYEQLDWIGLVVWTNVKQQQEKGGDYCPNTTTPFDMIELYDNDQFVMQYTTKLSWLDDWSEQFPNNKRMLNHLNDLINDLDHNIHGTYLIPFGERIFESPFGRGQEVIPVKTAIGGGLNGSKYRFSIRLIRENTITSQLKCIKVWAILR